MRPTSVAWRAAIRTLLGPNCIRRSMLLALTIGLHKDLRSGTALMGESDEECVYGQLQRELRGLGVEE